MLREGDTAVDVFVSYSHVDEDLRQVLEVHLAALRRQGSVSIWHDRKIAPGAEWEGEIDRNLTSANIVLLLVSPEFLASDYCWDKEMARALERHRAGEARVIPIILRPCDWHSSPLGLLQALPREARPVTKWSDRDEAFLDIVRGVRQVVEELRGTAAEPLRQEPKPGEERVNEKDGSALVYVPGGEYMLGADNIDSDSKPIHRAKLSPFWIGKLTVTNEQYGRFLAAKPAQGRPALWGVKRFSEPEQPVVGVSWMDAMAYCRWAGLALPSEAQWEAAARGTDQRQFPWSDAGPTSAHAKFGEDWWTGEPAPVGSYPKGAGPFGTLDQAGNVWEWCADVFRESAYAKRDGKLDPLEEGNERDEDLRRVFRGGSWCNPPGKLRAAIRLGNHARGRGQVVGFRVVLGLGPEHGL